MSIAPFLILPLVGGYAFSTIWHPSLYHAARESGHRLYLRAVFYAFVITLLVSFIHIIFWETENYQYLYSLVAYTLGEHNVSITNDTSKVFVLILTIPFGIFLGHFLNLNKWMTWLKIPERDREGLIAWEEYILRSAIETHDFEKLIFQAVKTKIPIMITLTSGKVYVGWATIMPNPSKTRDGLTIFPLMSGYRETETQQFIDTKYYDFLDEDKYSASRENYNVVLPIDQIISSHLFDVSTYRDKFDGSTNSQNSKL